MTPDLLWKRWHELKRCFPKTLLALVTLAIVKRLNSKWWQAGMYYRSCSARQEPGCSTDRHTLRNGTINSQAALRNPNQCKLWWWLSVLTLWKIPIFLRMLQLSQSWRFYWVEMPLSLMESWHPELKCSGLKSLEFKCPKLKFQKLLFSGLELNLPFH